jgi:hypothetical protein
MSENKSSNNKEPSNFNPIDKKTEKEIKKKAITNILEIIKFELKEDQENFFKLPLSDFQKEELLFEMLSDKEELYKKYQDARSIYDEQQKKEEENKILENLLEEEPEPEVLDFIDKRGDKPTQQEDEEEE